MPPKTHEITSRPDGKIKVSNLAKKQKQVSVDKDWKNLSTKDKLDLLAQVVGLLDADGKIILR
ncbi:MAG: hypothetical protein HN350_20545 [Phycisphaerales bacterium]|jgi:hypothetical protein|nr:hypothetical protein [Phycisphaerales bacterium]